MRATKDDEEPPTSKGAFASAAFGQPAANVAVHVRLDSDAPVAGFSCI